MEIKKCEALIDILIEAVERKNSEIFLLKYELDEVKNKLKAAENKAAELIATNNAVLCRKRIGENED